MIISKKLRREAFPKPRLFYLEPKFRTLDPSNDNSNSVARETSLWKILHTFCPYGDSLSHRRAGVVCKFSPDEEAFRSLLRDGNAMETQPSAIASAINKQGAGKQSFGRLRWSSRIEPRSVSRLTAFPARLRSRQPRFSSLSLSFWRLASVQPIGVCLPEERSLLLR